MILKMLKAIAIFCGIAVAAVAIVVFGAIIGVVITFLGSAFIIGVFFYVFWLTYQEHQKED